ncbi:MAG: class I tRNA ligase family protein, partial [Bacteroidaceae bacterium]|nr:class I tRNA ligase family protein [Bacteroidaceae bacterium]
KVTEDIEAMKFNTAIAAMMSLLNDISDHGSINKQEMRSLLLILNPFAPHITEEMWEQANFDGMLNKQEWPTFDENKCKDAQVEMVVQICGKIRARMMVDAESSKGQMLSTAKNLPEIQAAISGKNLVKEIVVKGKLVNLVAK